MSEESDNKKMILKNTQIMNKIFVEQNIIVLNPDILNYSKK